MMDDWKVANHVDPEHEGGTWVYYESSRFHGLHFRRSVDTPVKDHMGVNGTNHYYFGHTKTYSPNTPASEHQRLLGAWNDHFRVR
jgi:hypothetical protein